jgi:AraC-like DNA-binding protein
MGCQLMAAKCATSKNWRNQTGASGALRNEFAPVRQLRQFLIGRGKVAHLAQRPSRARAVTRTDRRASPTASTATALIVSPVERTTRLLCRALARQHQPVHVRAQKERIMKSIEHKSSKELRIGRKIKQAIDLLLDGSCATQKAVCERLGMSETYLSRAMKKDKIRAYKSRAADKAMADGKLAATVTAIRLVTSAKSEHVQLQASEFILALNGRHANPSAPGITINSNNGGAGYIVILASNGAEVIEGSVGDCGGVLTGRRMTDEERIHGVATTPGYGHLLDVMPTRREGDE